MQSVDVKNAAWFKSSYSGSGGDCVEVAHPLAFRNSSYSAAQSQDCVEVAELAPGAAVRDSQNPSDGHLAFAVDEWDAFLTAVKRDGL